jgi:hypothetical protein
MNLKIKSVSIILALILFFFLAISASKNFIFFSLVRPAFSQQPAPTVSPTPVSDEVIEQPEPLDFPFENERELSAKDILNGSLGSADFDCDGIKNIVDNCTLAYNPNQKNSDRDGYGDACDKKPTLTSRWQTGVENDPQ